MVVGEPGDVSFDMDQTQVVGVLIDEELELAARAGRGLDEAERRVVRDLHRGSHVDWHVREVGVVRRDHITSDVDTGCGYHMGTGSSCHHRKQHQAATGDRGRNHCLSETVHSVPNLSWGGLQGLKLRAHRTLYLRFSVLSTNACILSI